jgi:hypothetical protein
MVTIKTLAQDMTWCKIVRKEIHYLQEFFPALCIPPVIAPS